MVEGSIKRMNGSKNNSSITDGSNKDDDPSIMTNNTNIGLLLKGYTIVSSLVTSEECSDCRNRIWNFIHDVSGGMILPSQPCTWYPSSDTDDDDDPWPTSRTGSRMFQSLGAGFVLGNLHEMLAQRLYEPFIYHTCNLYTSKEGFTFHRLKHHNTTTFTIPTRKSSIL